MLFYQKEFRLKAYPRGFHLITEEILAVLPELSTITKGQLQIFIKHTSASLTINENADSTVRTDFETHVNLTVPENAHYYKHTYEGSDDMPAHIKASMFGASVQIPVTNGRLNLGIWQGVYLGEHRNNGGERTLVISLFGV